MDESEFMFVEVKRTAELTRIYALQLLDAPFSFADEIEQAVAELGMSILDCDDAVLSKLLGDYLPEVFYFFPLPSEEKNHPFLYTGILNVSIEQGGLLVMECYCMQISVLCNSNGKVLLDYCHDLELGPNGLVVWRGSGSILWDCGVYNELDKSFRFNPLPNLPADELYDMRLCGRDKVCVIHHNAYELATYSVASLSDTERRFREGRGDAVSLAVLLEDEAEKVWLTAPWFMEYYANYDLALRAVKRDFRVFTLLNTQLKHEPEIRAAFLLHAPIQIILVTNFVYDLNFDLWTNRSLYMKWLTESKSVYHVMPDVLKRDRLILLEFIEHTYTFGCIPPDLLENRNLMLECLALNGRLLMDLNAEFRNDAEMVMVAVKNDGIALKYASDELKNRNDIVAEAVRSWPDALKYASIGPQKDPAIITLFRTGSQNQNTAHENEDLPF